MELKSVDSVIKEYNMINSGDIIGVACSGGRDSMCLLHYLNANKDKLKCSIVAINIDHDLRENSAGDSEFVKNYCNANSIKCYSFKLDVNKFCTDNKMTIEQGAREARYKKFKKLIDSGLVTKVALGHHMTDQAETILLNIFRGAGLGGARGMDYVRNEHYIRPLLDTPKEEINAYITSNDIPYVEDETNMENDYSRNYVRNMVLPLIRNKWTNADATICNFGKICKEDDEYIESQVNDNAIVCENKNTVKIYTNYFTYPASVTKRLIRLALFKIGVHNDVEKKHIDIIRNMAIESENGNRISLPNGVSVIKEYNFVTITNKKIKPLTKQIKFGRGSVDIPSFGVIDIKLTKDTSIKNHKDELLIDGTKLPRTCVWRMRKQGDVFTRFGGTQKALNEYLIDKKVPSRIRDIVPVLAKGDEVFVIPGVEISDKVKVDSKSATAYAIKLVRF